MTMSGHWYDFLIGHYEVNDRLSDNIEMIAYPNSLERGQSMISLQTSSDWDWFYRYLSFVPWKFFRSTFFITARQWHSRFLRNRLIRQKSRFRSFTAKTHRDTAFPQVEFMQQREVLTNSLNMIFLPSLWDSASTDGSGVLDRTRDASVSVFSFINFCST